MTTPSRAPYGLGVPACDPEVLTRWHARIDIYGPVPDRPWMASVETLACDHDHEFASDAEDCALRLGREAISRRNGEAERVLAARRCCLTVMQNERGPAWIKVCAAHWTASREQHDQQEEAVRDPWTCPWAR